jgi:hypothetical protein
MYPMAPVAVDSYGDFDAPLPAREEWSSQMAAYEKAMEYFSGRIFDRRATEGEPGKPAPLLYPLRINLVRMMCSNQASALWGQWEEDLLQFLVKTKKDGEADKTRAELAKQVIAETWEYSNMSSRLHEAGFAQQVYGGTYLRIVVDPNGPHGLRFERLDPYVVFPVYDPINVEHILECWVAIPIDGREAQLAYGVSGVPEQTIYLEHWTEARYEVFVGEHQLLAKENPWGFIPIVYIPRSRLEGFYGLSLAEEVMGSQDELNSRLADMGDNMNNSAHPIRWIRNYKGNPEEDFAMGSDALWDLGFQTGDAKPEAGVLEAQAEPASSFNFINFMWDLTKNLASTSPVAFGEDEGSQRSGATLVLRLWPLLQAAKTTRLFWRSGLIRLHAMAIKMAAYRQDKYGKAVGYTVAPDFAQLVPQDRQLLVDEIIRRFEQDLISPEEAITRLGTDLGSVQEEIERIKAWVEYKTKMAVKAKPVPAENGNQQDKSSGQDSNAGQADTEAAKNGR